MSRKPKGNVYGRLHDAWVREVGGAIEVEAQHGGVGYATVGRLHLRYTDAELAIGWGPTFDRWANSRDWIADAPLTIDDLRLLLAEAERRGKAGEHNEGWGCEERITLRDAKRGSR